MKADGQAPFHSIEFKRQMEVVLDGIRAFSRGFEGTLVTETMLVKGLNDRDDLAEERQRFWHNSVPE